MANILEKWQYVSWYSFFHLVIKSYVLKKYSKWLMKMCGNPVRSWPKLPHKEGINLSQDTHIYMFAQVEFDFFYIFLLPCFCGMACLYTRIMHAMLLLLY